jgi:hypothetical protein
MKTLATTTAAAVMVVGLTGATAPTSAAGPTAARHQHVLRFVIQQVESHPTSEHHPVGVDRLRSLSTHAIVGYDNFSAIFNPDNDNLRFWMSLTLRGGMVDTYFNTNTNKKSFSGRITHGYGRFHGIKGRLFVRIADSGRTVYSLRYTR